MNINQPFKYSKLNHCIYKRMTKYQIIRESNPNKDDIRPHIQTTQSIRCICYHPSGKNFLSTK